MLAVLADENFNQRILRGLRLRLSELDAVLAQSAGLCDVSDLTLLAWAADQRRVVLTHDRQTMPRAAYNRTRSGQSIPGLIVVSDTMPTGEAIEALTTYLECGRAEDLQDLVLFLP